MKRHPLDLVSLTFGVIFLCVFGGWLIADVADADLPQPGWTVAGILIFFGTLGVIRAWRSSPGMSQATPVDLGMPQTTPADVDASHMPSDDPDEPPANDVTVGVERTVRDPDAYADPKPDHVRPEEPTT